MEDIPDSHASYLNQIHLVPMFGARVSPKDFELGFGLEGCSFSFILPTMSCPKQEGHESLSAPTLALMSASKITCCVLGIFLRMDDRCS